MILWCQGSFALMRCYNWHLGIFLHANIHDSTRQESRDVGSLERVGKSAVWEVLSQNSTAKIQLLVNIWAHWQIYLSNLLNIFLQIAKCISLNCKSYWSDIRVEKIAVWEVLWQNSRAKIQLFVNIWAICQIYLPKL